MSEKHDSTNRTVSTQQLFSVGTQREPGTQGPQEEGPGGDTDPGQSGTPEAKCPGGGGSFLCPVGEEVERRNEREGGKRSKAIALHWV